MTVRARPRTINYMCSSSSGRRPDGLSPSASGERPPQTSIYPFAVAISLGLACVGLVLWTSHRDSLLAAVGAGLGAALLVIAVAAWLVADWGSGRR